MFTEKIKDSVKFYQTDVFEENFIHAFTTRIGGNTPEPLSSFSMGYAGVLELKDYVDQNRKKMCGILGVDPENLLIPDQKHTDNIKIVSSVNDDVLNTDGLITTQKGLGLMLLFADCTPIILYSSKDQVLAVIHAGWRGTAKKIVQKAISMLNSELNVDPRDVKAAIGPAIGQCCYPVSEEVALELKSSINGNCDKIFKQEDNSDRFYVDLKMLNRQQLIESGVLEIDVIEACTRCENEIFYSYRAEGGKTGRHGAIACLR